MFGLRASMQLDMTADVVNEALGQDVSRLEEMWTVASAPLVLVMEVSIDCNMNVSSFVQQSTK